MGGGGFIGATIRCGHRVMSLEAGGGRVPGPEEAAGPVDEENAGDVRRGLAGAQFCSAEIQILKNVFFSKIRRSSCEL